MSEPMNDMSLVDREPDVAEPRGVRGTDGLWALRSYWETSASERARVCNGAGTRWLDRYPPWWLRWMRMFADRLWALDCRQAFDIHDWDYVRLPPTLAGKVEADDRLRDNLDAVIRCGRGPRWLTALRQRGARRYVRLVREFGFKAFFDRY